MKDCFIAVCERTSSFHTNALPYIFFFFLPTLGIHRDLTRLEKPRFSCLTISVFLIILMMCCLMDIRDYLYRNLSGLHREIHARNEKKRFDNEK